MKQAPSHSHHPWIRRSIIFLSLFTGLGLLKLISTLAWQRHHTQVLSGGGGSSSAAAPMLFTLFSVTTQASSSTSRSVRSLSQSAAEASTPAVAAVTPQRQTADARALTKTTHRQLLHETNGPRRGQRLHPGQSSRKLRFFVPGRRWRLFHLRTPDDPTASCSCRLECPAGDSPPRVNLYVTDYEGFWITDNWWHSVLALERVDHCGNTGELELGGNNRTVSKECSIQTFPASNDWYCYAAVHSVDGRVRGGCTVTCDFVASSA